MKQEHREGMNWSAVLPKGLGFNWGHWTYTAMDVGFFAVLLISGALLLGWKPREPAKRAEAN